MITQPRKVSKQARSICYKCSKNDYYASHLRMNQGKTYYSCIKKCHRAFDSHHKACIQLERAYCRRVGHTDENRFVKRSKNAVENKILSPTKSGEAGMSWQNDAMFIQSGPFEENNTVAALKRFLDG